MFTEAELKALLGIPEAERTPEQKAKLAEFLAGKSETKDEKDKDKDKPPRRDVPETWEQVFEHPRFKELTKNLADAKSRADALEKAAQAEQEKRLKEANDFKTLYEQAQAEIAGLKPKAESLTAMETTLNTILASEIASLPEAFRDIVPDGLSTQDKLNWISKNKAKLTKPAAFDIGAGDKGADKKNQTKDTGVLSDEEKIAARDLGMTEEEYAKHKDK